VPSSNTTQARCVGIGFRRTTVAVTAVGVRCPTGPHYRQFCGRSDHIRAGKTFMPCGSRKFGAPQGGFSGNMAGARRAITTPKFSFFFIFKVTGCFGAG